jgi:hypothetical protein
MLPVWIIVASLTGVTATTAWLYYFPWAPTDDGISQLAVAIFILSPLLLIAWSAAVYAAMNRESNRVPFIFLAVMLTLPVITTGVFALQLLV